MAEIHFSDSVNGQIMFLIKFENHFGSNIWLAYNAVPL